MTRHEIRKALRTSDPAAGREMSEVERSRMRAVIVSAARDEVRRRSFAPVLAAATAIATVLVTAMLLERERPRPVVVPPVAVAPVQAPPAAVVTPAMAKDRPSKRRARPRIAPAVIESTPVPATRIVFTAPGGTQILWFVGPSDAKEQDS